MYESFLSKFQSRYCIQVFYTSFIRKFIHFCCLSTNFHFFFPIILPCSTHKVVKKSVPTIPSISLVKTKCEFPKLCLVALKRNSMIIFGRFFGLVRKGRKEIFLKLDDSARVSVVANIGAQ